MASPDYLPGGKRESWESALKQQRRFKLMACGSTRKVQMGDKNVEVHIDLDIPRMIFLFAFNWRSDDKKQMRSFIWEVNQDEICADVAGIEAAYLIVLAQIEDAGGFDKLARDRYQGGELFRANAKPEVT